MNAIAPISFSTALPQAAPVSAPEAGQSAAAQAVQPGDSCCISDAGMKTMLGMLLVAALLESPDKEKDNKSLMAELLIGAAMLQTLVDACPFITMKDGCCAITPVVGADMASAATMFPGGFA